MTTYSCFRGKRTLSEFYASTAVVISLSERHASVTMPLIPAVASLRPLFAFPYLLNYVGWVLGETGALEEGNEG
jgi:hypothetical protein